MWLEMYNRRWPQTVEPDASLLGHHTSDQIDDFHNDKNYIVNNISNSVEWLLK